MFPEDFPSNIKAFAYKLLEYIGGVIENSVSWTDEVFIRLIPNEAFICYNVYNRIKCIWNIEEMFLQYYMHSDACSKYIYKYFSILS